MMEAIAFALWGFVVGAGLVIWFRKPARCWHCSLSYEERAKLLRAEGLNQQGVNGTDR